MSVPDPARVASASRRFERFFSELRHAFVEREDLLAQIALALLAKEHVLMTGPPGTAKSQVASAVLRRILDEETGRPSLYARQFTESTVQTDLVGPIDFKTLMDTGRTEHFTDQGILGAVHAFLDEVFDGRDMLLRSALNVLQERELKEGTKTTRGLIECALMTSNRYLAEILEGSRDTLLAFVDRIAFVAFMPRGFADPKNLATVLRRHVGGTGKLELAAPLSVQDLDALQAVVDSVHVSEAACDAIASFLESLEVELAAAAKSDPTFIPTRYVSTRTAVRCGRVLRAIVVFQRIFVDAGRPLEVLPDDFRWLRLHLLLSGPSAQMIDKLLARETDPRERRQLSILRTEREAFERCLAKVPQFPPSPRTPPPEMAKVERAATDALSSGDPNKLARSAADLVPLAHAGGTTGDRAATLVRQLVDTLSGRALRAGLTASARPQHGSIEQVVTELEGMAAKVDEAARPGAVESRALSRWLRGRALALLDDAVSFEAGAHAGDVESLLDDRAKDVSQRIARRIGHVGQLAETRRRLLASGADVPDPAASERAWGAAFERLEEDVAALLDAGFRASVTGALSRASSDRLDEVLTALAPELSRLDELGERISALSEKRSKLKERVAGPRIGDLVAALFRGIDASDRPKLIQQVERLHRVLAHAGLREAIEPWQWVVWSAIALVRSDRGAPVVQDNPPGHETYRALRGAEQRMPIALALREIALRVAPFGQEEIAPADAERRMQELFAQLPDALRGDAAEIDLARVTRAIDHLERWWWALTGGADGVDVPLDQANERLRTILASRILHVVLDDAALLRFALETRVISETFPVHVEHGKSLRERIDSLSQRVRRHVTALARTSGDRAWSEVLAKTGRA